MTKSDKLKILIGAIAALLVAIIFITILHLATGQNIGNKATQTCGASVENWVEGQTSPYSGATSYSVSYNSKIVLNINTTTADCLGIVDNHTNKINTGENYLYINPKTQHFDIISKEQIEEHQSNGDLCLTADQSWNNIGKKRICVGYLVTYMAKNNGFIFLDEKEDYVNGFITAITHDNLISWNQAVDTYLGQGITVTGAIEEYQNHPEIKVYELKQINNNPIPYAYSTEYGFVYKTSNSKL